ncbi:MULTISPECIES: ABC transporter ATP-binding protein [unclassified Flavobacterium]|uniref:ABC transporter ATP-binding protein n=1 Tax=unclassified Flavobacterium TaxID=196869 RepID=UPI00193A17AB|nr:MULTISPECIES: ABC transporter ATP-binding protein [unclassified Flavobacterium]
MKLLIRKFLPQFTYFYQKLRYRLFILVIASVLVGLLDGLGLAMFLPLIELFADANAVVSSEGHGNFTYLLKAFDSLGITLNLATVLIIMFVFFVFKGLSIFLVRYLRVLYQQYFVAKTRLDCVDALSNYSYEGYVTSDAGVIQNALTGEADRLMQSFVNYTDMIQQFMMLLTYVVLAVLSSPEFALLIVIGAVLSNLIFTTLYRKTKVLSKELVQGNNSFQGYIIQAVVFFKYLKATSTMPMYSQFLKNKVVDIERTNRKMGVLSSVMLGAKEPITIGIVLLVIYIQVTLLEGVFSAIVLSLLFFYRGLTAMNTLQNSYNQFLGKMGSIENMNAFVLNLKEKATKTGTLQFEQLLSDIEVKDLSFAYANGVPILKSISLTIKKNESIAFVGESGSGKTTLLNLISGLLTPTNGSIYIDGINTNTLNIATFQQRIGYITQEPVLFDDTIYNNVTLWSPKTAENLKKFNKAIEQSNLTHFLAQTIEKENTPVGSNGVSLSGGQKQRITIARELFKEVDFLLLDEATSALDSETENTIQQNIEQLKGQYTIITIAHRLATIKNADRVFVFDKGRVIDSGSYEELLEHSIAFKKMISYQKV